MFFLLSRRDTLTLRANAVSGYSEQRMVCLSSFAAIPAVHHCHQLLIDQRLMRLMFTAARLSLPPITLRSDTRRTRLHSPMIFESDFQ